MEVYIKKIKLICIGLVALVSAGWFCGQGMAENSEKESGMGYPVLDWQYFGSGGGGAFQFVAAAPTQPNRVYCGIDVGGIYRSDDGGIHWYPIYAGLRYTGGNPAQRVFSIAVSHQNPDVFYIWTGYGGLWKTTDGGFSYEQVGKQEIPGELRNMPQMVEINPKRDQDCMAFATGHFNRTTDGGKTLQAIPNPGNADKKISAAAVFYPTEGGEPILWLGDETFHRSIDGGKSWQKCSMTGWPGGPGHTFGASFYGRILWTSEDSVSGKPVLFMLSQNDKGGLYRSGDLGETWQKAPVPMEGDKTYYGREKLFPHSALWMDPDDADHFGISSWPEEGHVTQDGGKTWVHSTVCPDQPGRYIESGGATNIQNDGYVFVSKKKERVFVRTQFSLFRSDDGGKIFYCLEHRRLGKHHYQSAGVDAQFVGAIVVDPSNGFRYIQDDDVGIARSEDFGRTFHTLRYVVTEDKESDSGFAGEGTFNGHSGCNIIVDGGYQPSRLYTWFSTLVPLPNEIENGMERAYSPGEKGYRRGL